IWRYLSGGNENTVWKFIRLAWSSVAFIAVAPMQDILELDYTARMNTPGTSSNNWQWRFKKSDYNDRIVNKLIELTQLYDRD
ncbi:MAG TPA: 4-alpha-glucanotransferase, partial [Bacteroidales bacterium]|nr:4-alpha-glucanotransferase [Bacteroidales bacterium]